MVVGHYGCSGVQAALAGARIGLADNWLRHVQDVRDRHRDLIDAAPEAVRHDLLCSLNVIEQVRNVAHTTVLRDAWAKGQQVALHGWVYGLQDGLLQDLRMSVSGVDGIDGCYRDAVAAVASAARQTGVRFSDPKAG